MVLKIQIRLLLLLSICVAVLFVFGCSVSGPAAREPAGVHLSASEFARLEREVSGLFVIPVEQYTDSHADTQALAGADSLVGQGIGGVIFMRHDAETQLDRNNRLRAAAPDDLWIMQDMEWGAGMRVRGGTVLPRAMSVAASGDERLAYALGWVTGVEARLLGVDQVNAPVLDVNTNPANPVIGTRSYGQDPDLVARFGAAQARGLLAAGVLPTLKHFPGHGNTAVDSHLGLPVLQSDSAALFRTELAPFRQVLRQVSPVAVMTAHVAVPALTPGDTIPASLSPRITTGILRKVLGFEGLIVTDALNMKGVTSHYDTGEVAVRALEAGADILLMSENVPAARQAVLEAVRSGRLTPARIDSSAMRLQDVRTQIRTQQRSIRPSNHSLGAPLHQAVAEEIAFRSLTLLRNQHNVLPLGERQPVQIRYLNERTAAGATFDEQLGLYADLSGDTGPIIVPVLTSDEGPDLWSRFRSLLGPALYQRPVIVLGFGSPYALTGVPDEVDAIIAAYGSSEATLKAAAQALVGRSSLSGTLPVDIPLLAPHGAGLKLPSTAPSVRIAEGAGMHTAALVGVDSVMKRAVEERAFPGGVVAVGRPGAVTYLKAFGRRTYSDRDTLTVTARYDLASLTKVVATTTAVMLLYDQGRIRLDDPVYQYLKEFESPAKRGITIRHLLTHTSGLPTSFPWPDHAGESPEVVRQAILDLAPVNAPGAEMRYSDTGAIILALVVETATGLPFDQFCREAIFEPLGMTSTGFQHVDTPDTTAVPTEIDNVLRKQLVRGVVHDETAYLLGGVAGHAGLFSTALDLSRFADMLLHEGYVGGRQFIRPETVRLFTRRADPEGHSRALGWDTKTLDGYSSAGAEFSASSFGHTGFTGTSIWIDPEKQLYTILLTNRVHPDRSNNAIRTIRPAVGDLAARAVAGPPNLFTLLPLQP